VITTLKEEDIKLEITDLMGKYVTEQYAHIVAGENRIGMLNTEALKNGIYYLNVISSEKVITQKNR
jgi:hypothetical protein